MKRFLFRILLPLAALLAVGSLLVMWLVDRTDQKMRFALIEQTRLLARAVNVEYLAALSAMPTDAQKAEYRRLKEELTVVRQAYPLCRFIYLAARKPDGSIAFFVDSEPAESKDVSPPGQSYTEASKQFRFVFESQTPITEGPLVDRWGVWISALVPIIDPQNGATLALLGMDVDARDWNSLLARAALPAVLLTGALATIWVFAVVLFDRRSRSSDSPKLWMRRLEARLVIAVGLTLSVAAAWQAYTVAVQRDTELFESSAAQQAGEIVEQLENIRDLQLEGLARFYTARENISAGEFEEFARSLTKNVSVTTWGWIPAVPAAEKDAFEAAARASGYPEFTIWQLDAQGRRVPAAGRDIYYPVYHVAPAARVERVMGNDSGAEPVRLAALNETLASGLTTGTDPVTLASELAHQKSIVIYRSIFGRTDPTRLRGFVAGAVRMEQLLRARVSPDRVPLMEIALLRKGAARELLAATWIPGKLPPPGRVATRPLLAFGKIFTVTIRESPAPAGASPLRPAGLTLFFGIALTGTVAALARVSLRQRERLERRVVERTAELQASEQSYRNQFANNSAVMLLLDPANGAIVDANAAAINFYGFSLERLRAMRITEINVRSADEVMGIIDDVAQGRRNRFEARHRLANGQVRDVSVASSGIQYGGRSILHSIVQDITEQRQAQESLRESAERFRSIISVSNTGGWVYHSDTKYLWASPEYFSMLGLREADFDLSGKENLVETWVDLLHGEDRQTALDHFAAYLKNGSVGTYESYFRMRHRNGDWVWIWSRGQTLRDDSGNLTNLTVGTHIDITERKRAALALEKTHESLKERIKELRCLYAISKLISESERSVDEVLAVAADIIPTGWRYPEIAHARISWQGRVFVSADFKTSAWSQSAHIVVGGEVIGAVEVYYLEDRSPQTVAPFITEEQTLLNNIATQFGVMIERRGAQEMLRRLSSIIEQAPLSVVIIDQAHTVEYVNPNLCSVMGYTKEELVGRNVWAFGTQEMQPEVYTDLRRALDANQVWTGELRSRKKNGEIYLENVVTAPLVDENGRVTHYVALKDDITAQRHFEAETTAMLAKEREVSDMKSQFISVASHEFRTPLAAAVGSLELLERHAGRMTEAKRLELLARAQRSLGRLTSIMNDVLQVSRADSGRVKIKRMDVDLGRFVQDVVNEVVEGDRQQHVFSFQQSGGPGTVSADTNLLHHIISNLVGNAARYSPAGTQVTVTLELDVEAFTLTVVDEGIGIPVAERERIFEPFVRGSNVGQIGGTGLGLNIVKRYTELMGGRIEVLPTERGAAFRVWVPCLQPVSQS